MKAGQLIALGGLAACLGCSRGLPPPAGADYLTRSVYTFYMGFGRVGPSGILVSAAEGTNSCHFIVTAGHVVRELQRRFTGTGRCGIGFRKADDISVVRRIDGPSNLLVPVVHPGFPSEDVGFFALSDVSGIVANGGLVCGIGLDRPLESGVGIVRDASDCARYGITNGSAVFAYCTDPGRMPRNSDYDWNCSTVERRGAIVDLEARIRTGRGDILQRAVVVDFASENGNSGGPVFAYGTVDGVRYPFLLGVISGGIKGREGQTAVAPVGPIVEEILRFLKSHPIPGGAGHVAAKSTATEPAASAPLGPMAVMLPPAPEPDGGDPVRETVAHAKAALFRPGVRRVRVMMSLDGAADNALRVSFGCDRDGDGTLGIEEGALQFGWDAGGWCARDYGGGYDLRSEESREGRQRLEWTWDLDGRGNCTAFGCTANGRPIFGELSEHPERVAPEEGWDIIQIKRNGVTAPNESVGIVVD